MQNNENLGEITTLVFSQHGKAVTSSLQVAKVFGKNHAHVLRDIKELLDAMVKLDSKKGLSNFGESSYINKQNKTMPMYLLTKDAFTLLVMGYTGEKALKFKLDFIEAFNAMENYIIELQNQLQKTVPQTTNEIAFFEELKKIKFEMEELKMKGKKQEEISEKLHERIFYLENISDNRPYIPVNTPPKPLSDFYVYFAYNPENGLTKIGRSQYIEKRLKQFQTIAPNMEITMFINVNSLEACIELESFLHKLFNDQHHSGELFLLKKKHFTTLELLKIAVEALS